MIVNYFTNALIISLPLSMSYHRLHHCWHVRDMVVQLVVGYVVAATVKEMGGTIYHIFVNIKL